MKCYYKILFVCVAFLMTSCNYNPLAKYYVTKDQVTAQINALNLQHEVDIKAKEKEIVEKKEAIIRQQDNQLQEGANKLYGANEAFKYYTSPTRLDLIINNRVTEASAALGKVPSFEAIKTENARLTTELNEKLTTIDQLRKDHIDALSKNAKLANDTEETKKALAALEKSKLEIEQKYIGENGKLAADLKIANDKLADAAAKAVDKQAAIERLKTKLMMWCGIGAAIALVAAIYSPVCKEGLALISGILAAVTAAIPFIEGWMILAGGLTAIAGITIYYLRAHNISEKTNHNLVHAIEDTKNELGEDSEVLMKNLASWNSTYSKDHLGNVITKVDKNVENYIKSKLMNSGQLDAGKKSPTTGSL